MRRIWISLAIVIFLIGALAIFLYWRKPFLCREWYGKPLETGLVGNPDGFAAEYQTILTTAACIVSVEEGTDPLFPDSSVRLKIGYFDSSGKLFVYPARLGGEDFDGNKIEVGLCSRIERSTDCKSATPAEALLDLKKGQIVEVDTVIDDGAPWAASAGIRKYRGTLNLIKIATKSGRDYPNPSLLGEDFVIQIMQLMPQ